VAFKRARTEEQIRDRRDEILNACSLLYDKKGFEGVTVKEIARLTSFSRPSVYNYYATKEEILLDLLLREYRKWGQELSKFFLSSVETDKNTFCRILAQSLTRHEKMMKLISLNLNSIENNCRDQKLEDFKRELLPFFDILSGGIRKFFPHASSADIRLFITAFTAYYQGLYPLTHPSGKQLKAMKGAGFREFGSFEPLCRAGISLLVSGL